MANTFSQIYVHAVFAVRNRESALAPEWRERLYDYIAAIVQDRGNKMLAIGGTDNHVHIFFGMNPEETISSLMLAVKRDSSRWIRKEVLTDGNFHWQSGYGAFTYSKSQLPKVINYIQQQEKHHARKSFREEYLEMLRKAEVKFDERYIFEDV